MKIVDILNSRKPTLSFEFFPPKTTESESVLFDTIDSLSSRGADFSSVTFGALGTATDKSIDYTIAIKDRLRTEVMMHLTCVGFDNGKIDDILDELESEGIENILALRGDIPVGREEEVKSREFTYASDLVNYIAKRGGFSIGAACYPEGHVEAKSIDDDIENLIRKIDNGVDFLVTQLFFDIDKFYIFKDKLSKRGVKTPIVAGIMPITSLKQIEKFTSTCGASIPKSLYDKIKGRGDDYVATVGLEFAVSQISDLKRYGADGIHLYTLNKSSTVSAILSAI